MSMSEPRMLTLSRFNLGGTSPSEETKWVSYEDYLKLKRELEESKNISIFSSVSNGKSVVPQLIEYEYLKSELEHCRKQLRDSESFQKQDKLNAEVQFLRLENNMLRANIEYLDRNLDDEIDKNSEKSRILSAITQKMFDIKNQFDNCNNLDDQTLLVKNMVDGIFTPPPKP